jgi:hypothetical protein
MQLQTNKQINKQGCQTGNWKTYTASCEASSRKTLQYGANSWDNFVTKRLNFQLYSPIKKNFTLLQMIMTSRKKEKTRCGTLDQDQPFALLFLAPLVGHFNFRYMHAILFIRSVTPLYIFVLFVCLIVTMNTSWTCPISLWCHTVIQFPAPSPPSPHPHRHPTLYYR